MKLLLSSTVRPQQQILTRQGWLTIQAVTSDGAITAEGHIPFGTPIYGWQASARPSSTAATSKNSRT